MATVGLIAGLECAPGTEEDLASDLEPLSPYVERPSMPEGVTVDEYRRARLPRTKPLTAVLYGRVRRRDRYDARPGGSRRRNAIILWFESAMTKTFGRMKSNTGKLSPVKAPTR